MARRVWVLNQATFRLEVGDAFVCNLPRILLIQTFEDFVTDDEKPLGSEPNVNSGPPGAVRLLAAS